MTEMNSLNWADLATSDGKAASDFYCAVLELEAMPMPMPEGAGDYIMLHRGGLLVAAIFQASPEMLQQMPPHWKCYVAVENAHAAAARARELGGNVLMEPFDVMDAGRMAMVQDPSGGVLAVWQAINHQGSQIFGEPGSLCWMELLTRDTAAAATFYEAYFGWTAKNSQALPEINYTEFHLGGRGIAGMMPMPEMCGDMPACWTPYFMVADLDATVGKTTELGGKVAVPSTEIPGMGHFAWLIDPQGATFAVIQVVMA